MSLVKTSAIKKLIRDKGFRVSKDAFAQFERKISLAIEEAVRSADADNRKTVQPSDIV